MAKETETKTQFDPSFQFRSNQKAAVPLLGNQSIQYALLAGGGRSGKSFVILLFIILRALEYADSRHGVFRRTLASCRDTIFNQTLPAVLKALHPNLREQLNVNKSDLIVTFPNGSVITFDGLDEHRRDKVLGSEWQTIWMNECNEFDYEDVEILNSRLNGKQTKADGTVIKRKMWFDCNPVSEIDWDCRLFRDQISPVTNKPLANADRYSWLQINNEDEEYLEQYANASEATKNRLVKGIWTNNNPNAIFNMDTIDKFRVTDDKLPAFKRIVVSIDPAVTSNAKSDLTGLGVQALGHDGHIYVLADHSGRMTPQQWAKRAIELFRQYKADVIVAEKNQGGDLVAQTIYQELRTAPVKLVHATRGKEVRAEPVSILYNAGKVHHVAGPDASSANALDELEREMCSFPNQSNKSPDRMDALVWGISELAQLSQTSRGGFKQSRNRVY